MRRITVTYLTTLIFFQGIFAPVDVFSEIEIMIEDYQLHKVKYGDDLTTFLSKHYGNLQNNHKEEHQKDTQNKNYPIQSGFNSSQQIYFLQVIDFSISNIAEINDLSNNFYYQDEFSSFEKQKIFQPPKVA